MLTFAIFCLDFLGVVPISYNINYTGCKVCISD